MGATCCGPAPRRQTGHADSGHNHSHLNLDESLSPEQQAGRRRVLWAVLAINAGMFVIEIGAGLAAGSSALQADALDFFGDAANYALTLLVLGMSLRHRAVAALVKGGSMGVFGIYVVGSAVWHAMRGTVPEAEVMGVVGLMALSANLAALFLVTGFRHGDSNMRSAWVCSRNDVVGNVAVILAALGVFGTGTGWPDFIVAGIMAALALWGAVQIIRQALGELRGAEAVHA